MCPCPWSQTLHYGRTSDKVRFRDSLALRNEIAPACGEVFVFLDATRGPVHHRALHTVAPAQAKRQRQFRLRQVARPAFDRTGTALTSVQQANGGADRIAIRFGSCQLEANTAIPGYLIVAIEVGRAVVGGDQDIQIAIAIEIAEGERPGPLWARESGADCAATSRNPALPCVQEQVRRLCIADVAADVAHGVVDVAVDHQQIQPAVEIRVEEEAAEAEARRDARADIGCAAPGRVQARRGRGWYSADHLVVEIRDRQPGMPELS